GGGDQRVSGDARGAQRVSDAAERMVLVRAAGGGVDGIFVCVLGGWRLDDRGGLWLVAAVGSAAAAGLCDGGAGGGAARILGESAVALDAGDVERAGGGG